MFINRPINWLEYDKVYTNVALLATMKQTVKEFFENEENSIDSVIDLLNEYKKVEDQKRENENGFLIEDLWIVRECPMADCGCIFERFEEEIDYYDVVRTHYR